jgi:hypothetical protein
MLAGVSVDYYARLERGNLAVASESVLEAVAGVLQLEDAERHHLHDLAGNIEPTPARRSNRPKLAATPRPAVLAVLAGMTGVPPTPGTPGWTSSPPTTCAGACGMAA